MHVEGMNCHHQRVQHVKSRIGMFQYVKHAPYNICRYLIIPYNTESYRFLALINLIMYSDTDHVSVAIILQYVIEQLFHTSYNVTDRT